MLLRKLYIDSRARSSGTDSDFRLSLKANVQCPEQRRAYVDSVFLCNVFGSVDETRNMLFLEEFDEARLVHHDVLIPHGHYDAITLAQAVQKALNDITSVANVYTVRFQEKRKLCR